ncbi:MAG TPA: hypothetical protein VGR73_02685 [Bryobacteraceae bacterium]|nr:hypothetical protein [Bryobacteraceae bacterium]
MNGLKLPPLILHPFADSGGPDKLVESSRANLMLQGLLPSGERSSEDLERVLLDGRFCEIRMLFYVGKDLTRWIEQCLEHVDRHPESRDSGIRYQSFAAYLVEHTPLAVQEKLRKWGVADYKAIFARALGLCALLGAAPHPDTLAHEFIRNYYRYADHMFQVRQSEATFTDISGLGFDFEIFASGEYSRMLEREWAEN